MTKTSRPFGTTGRPSLLISSTPSMGLITVLFCWEGSKKEGNYMNKKSSKKRNLMSVERLLSQIAKYADETEKRLKEAHQMTKATFPMVQGMPSGNKCTPELAVRVLMDCEGNAIACDYSEYGKEQNIGLHDVVSPVAMAWVTATETYIVDGIPTTIKADYAYCPFCAYACSKPPGYQQSHADELPSHTHVRVAWLLFCAYAIKKMIEHSAEVHNMARARPAREKGGD